MKTFLFWGGRGNVRDANPTAFEVLFSVIVNLLKMFIRFSRFGVNFKLAV